MANVSLVRYFICLRTFHRNEKTFRLSVPLSDGVSLMHLTLPKHTIRHRPAFQNSAMTGSYVEVMMALEFPY